MSLGKKIIILATLVVLGMQCLSSMLEIGFLYRRIESGYLAKYKLSSMLIKRKFERSLLYGKKIDKLNYARLLKGLVPRDIANIAVVDSGKNILFSLNSINLQNQLDLTKKENAVFKKGRYYTMAFPLFQENEFKGNLFVFISDKGIQDKILPIIQEVIIKSLLVFLALIVMLYWLLHIYMEKPLGQYINTLKKAIVKNDRMFMNTVGVNMQNYFGVVEMIDTLKNDKWLQLKNEKGVCLGDDEQIELIHLLFKEHYDLFNKIKISADELKTSGEKNAMDNIPWKQIDDNMKKYKEIKNDYDFVVSIQRLWNEINEHPVHYSKEKIQA